MRKFKFVETTNQFSKFSPYGFEIGYTVSGSAAPLTRDSTFGGAKSPTETARTFWGGV